MARPESAQPPASVPLAMGLTALGVLVGYAIKHQCAVNPWADNFQYTHYCYNEIQALFGVRGIGQGLIPYIDTRFEYPVLTGIFMDLAGRWLRLLVRWELVASNNDAGYLFVSAALLTPLVFVVTFLLRPRVTRNRLMIWAIGAPTILYTFHNWDLLATCAAVWGLVALEQSRITRSGTALGIGASAKLFPAFLLPGALLDRWAARDRAGARKLVIAFLATYALINLPWILISGGKPRFQASAFPGIQLREAGTNGWLEVWLFHADRYPDYWTIWYWLAKYGRRINPSTWWDVGFTGYRNFVSVTSLILFALGTAWILWRGWRRRTEPQGYPVVAVGLAVVVVFLLTSKVYSPQYALWVAPLLAMLTIPWRLVLAYLGAEVAVLVAGFNWFTVFDQPDTGWLGALEAFVWLRALTLVLLLVSCLRATRLFPSE